MYAGQEMVMLTALNVSGLASSGTHFELELAIWKKERKRWKFVCVENRVRLKNIDVVQVFLLGNRSVFRRAITYLGNQR